MVTKNQSKLILQGIALHKKSQRLSNKKKYSEARKIRADANKILDGFKGDVVAAHFALFQKGKR